MLRIHKFTFWLFVSLTSLPLWSQTKYPTTNFDANETVTLSPAPTPIRIDFPTVDTNNDTIQTVAIKRYPLKGSLSAVTFDGSSSNYYVFRGQLITNDEFVRTLIQFVLHYQFLQRLVNRLHCWWTILF